MTTPRQEQQKFYEDIQKKYRNLLILKDFGYCEPQLITNDAKSKASDFSKPISKNLEQLQPRTATNYFLGCGNMAEIATFKQGETILDLGCGCGNDCILAAQAVGKNGHVIGLDMLAEMLERARKNSSQSKLKNIKFVRGYMENIPLESKSVDMVISNCVINLAPDKEKVYTEIFRVLKSNGRIAISDILCHTPATQNNIQAYCACLYGAITPQHLEGILQKIGFKNISIKTIPIQGNPNYYQASIRAEIF